MIMTITIKTMAVIKTAMKLIMMVMVFSSANLRGYECTPGGNLHS